MRAIIAALAAFAAAACVYSPENYPKSPPTPQPASASGIVLPGHRDKIPDTPYEVRKAEIERDRQIAGKTGPSYRPLFKNQKAPGDEDGGS